MPGSAFGLSTHPLFDCIREAIALLQALRVRGSGLAEVVVASGGWVPLFYIADTLFFLFEKYPLYKQILWGIDPSGEERYPPIFTMFVDLLLSPYSVLSVLFLYYFIPYLQASSLRGIPSPFPAAFSNFWLLFQCRRGRRYQAVHDAHSKYGPLVRLQPHHVSIADSDAIQVVYGHGNGFLKS